MADEQIVNTGAETPPPLPSWADFTQERATEEKARLSPAAEKPPPLPTPETKVESAATAGEAEQATQEKPEKRDRSAEGRAAELMAAGRHTEALKILSDAAEKKHSDRFTKLEQELQELRTRKPAESSPVETKPAATEVKADEDPEPDLEKMLAEAKPDEPATKIIAKHAKDLLAWNNRQADKKVQSAKAAEVVETQKRAHEEKMTAARTKHPNFDQTIQNAINELGGPASYPNVGLAAAIQSAPDLGDALMAMVSDLAEYRRIASLPPQQAYWEAVAYISKKTAAPPPEKPKPPVTNNPAPTGSLKGGDAPVSNDSGLSDGSSWNQFTATRAKLDQARASNGQFR